MHQSSTKTYSETKSCESKIFLTRFLFIHGNYTQVSRLIWQWCIACSPLLVEITSSPPPPPPPCVFPSASSFLSDFTHRSLTVSGQRKGDKKKWFFLPWSPPSSTSSPPPPPPPPSLPSQTAGVTGLQCKPLFTLAVILQVIKTTWSSPTISPLNARCVMTSWLPLPPITHTHLSTISAQGRGVIWRNVCVCTSWAFEYNLVSFGESRISPWLIGADFVFFFFLPLSLSLSPFLVFTQNHWCTQVDFVWVT